MGSKKTLEVMLCHTLSGPNSSNYTDMHETGCFKLSNNLRCADCRTLVIKKVDKKTKQEFDKICN